MTVATLHSHPDLRKAVERAEERVLRCISSEDLRDHAPDRWGDGYDAWRDRWQHRSPEDYWAGLPDHVCYPWNEPDMLIWNWIEEQAERGWRVVPPSWCLKNRMASYESDADVQICRSSTGTVRPGAKVMWADLHDTVIVSNAADGSSVRLDGPAASLWRAIASSGEIELAAQTVADEYVGVGASRVAEDLTRLVQMLAERGFVVVDPMRSPTRNSARGRDGAMPVADRDVDP